MNRPCFIRNVSRRDPGASTPRRSFAASPGAKAVFGLWLGALALCAWCFAQDGGMNIHTKRPGGTQGGGTGRSQLRKLPDNYVARSPELKKMMDEEAAGLNKAGIAPGTAAAAAAASGGEGKSATSHITGGGNDKPAIDPSMLGLPAQAGGLHFLIHRCTNIRSTALKTVIEPFLSGDGSVEAASEADVVYVRDTPESLADIRRIIDHADRPQEQVMVEAQIIELRLDKDFEKDVGLWLSHNGGEFKANLAQLLGVPGDSPYLGNTSSQKVPAGNGNIGWADQSAWSIARTGSKFNVGGVVRFLEERGRAKMLSHPRMVVRRGFKGQFLSGKEVPYYVYSDDQSSSSYAVQFKKIGIRLDVEPLIVTCDTVRMKVAPEVSAIDGYTEEGSGTHAYPRQPIVTVRNVQTEVEIKDGETIAIGGLFNTLDSKVRRGVPGLSAIPVIRHAFTSVRNIEERSQLVIFLTIKILNQGEVGGFVYPPTRELPMRSLHDEFTHLQPKVLDGDPAHKWDNPEAILPPRRVEVEYLPDGRIAWNNPNERMHSNFPETPCPQVPLVDPEDFCDSEAPQRIREPWTKPGWPESQRPGGGINAPAEIMEEFVEELVADANGGYGVASDGLPVHYCGTDFCGVNPCARTRIVQYSATPQVVTQVAARPVATVQSAPVVVQSVPAPVFHQAPPAPPATPSAPASASATLPAPVVYASAPSAAPSAPVTVVSAPLAGGLGVGPCDGVGPCSVTGTTLVAAPGENHTADCEARGGYRSYPVITSQRCVTPRRGETTVFRDEKSSGTVVEPPPQPLLGPDHERRSSPPLPGVRFGPPTASAGYVTEGYVETVGDGTSILSGTVVTHSNSNLNCSCGRH